MGSAIAARATSSRDHDPSSGQTANAPGAPPTPPGESRSRLLRRSGRRRSCAQPQMFHSRIQGTRQTARREAHVDGRICRGDRGSKSGNVTRCLMPSFQCPSDQGQSAAGGFVVRRPRSVRAGRCHAIAGHDRYCPHRPGAGPIRVQGQGHAFEGGWRPIKEQRHRPRHHVARRQENQGRQPGRAGKLASAPAHPGHALRRGCSPQVGLHPWPPGLPPCRAAIHHLLACGAGGAAVAPARCRCLLSPTSGSPQPPIGLVQLGGCCSGTGFGPSLPSACGSDHDAGFAAVGGEQGP